jgi:uncharacterized protein (DUF1330 family)
MAVDASRHVTWMGLEVTDAERYARYRAAMKPVLETFGGRFDHDFAVARVLTSSASPRINRVFALSFPDAASRARFFRDPRYLGIRAEHFVPAVASSEELSASPDPPDRAQEFGRFRQRRSKLQPTSRDTSPVFSTSRKTPIPRA